MNISAICDRLRGGDSSVPTPQFSTDPYYPGTSYSTDGEDDGEDDNNTGSWIPLLIGAVALSQLIL